MDATLGRENASRFTGRRLLARSERKASPRRADDYAAKASAEYAAAYGWADAAAIEASIGANRAYTAQMAALGRLCDALGVNRTLGRHALLRLLYFAPQRRLTQVDIANEMQVTSANVTFLVDGLEKERLVARRPSSSDRRTVYVELTDAGLAFAELIVPSMARFMARMLDGFSDAEKRRLSRLLAKLRRNAEAFDAKALD